ncbi:MAG: ATP-binding protein [Ramlibacter sp.]
MDITGSEQSAGPNAVEPDPLVEAYYERFGAQRSQALLRVLTSVVWVADPEGRFTSEQTLWSNYTGQTWEQQRDHGWLGALHLDDRAGVLDCLSKAKREQRLFYAPARLWHRATASYRQIEARGIPLFNDAGALTEWVGTCKDVDDQKRAEEALHAADRQKDAFIATVAHELRNPLAPIRNAVHILMRKGREDLQLVWTREVIDRQVAQMARLLDDLMDVSRIRENKIELRKSRVTLDSILDSAIEVSRPLLEQKGHHLELSIVKGAVYVQADPHRLSQVFSNLLNNAAKYTPPGGRISLSVRTEPHRAVVTIKDTGIGISAEMLPKIFEMFTQARNTPNRAEGGLGIGLSLAKSLIELHGGSIEVRSEGLGSGSEFIAFVPLASARAPSAAAAPTAAAHVAALRIVVAEDNQDAGETLTVLLQIMGHDVRLARDGAEALGACRRDAPEVAILDIDMPGLSGYEVARTLRSEFPGIFLIAASGWGQAEDISRGRAAGFDRHLIKPISPDELTKALSESSRP